MKRDLKEAMGLDESAYEHPSERFRMLIRSMGPAAAKALELGFNEQDFIDAARSSYHDAEGAAHAKRELSR